MGFPHKAKVAAVAFGIAIFGGAPAHLEPLRTFKVESDRCSWSSLKAQRFSGALDVGTSFEYIGTIVGRKNKYTLYLYDHVNKSLPLGLQSHEVRRLLVMTRGCRYGGSYTVDDRPLRVSKSKVIFSYSKELGNYIDFEKGPPARVLIDGEVVQLAP